jgi:DNA polymerase elongation subunit (family B)
MFPVDSFRFNFPFIYNYPIEDGPHIQYSSLAWGDTDSVYRDTDSVYLDTDSVYMDTVEVSKYDFTTMYPSMLIHNNIDPERLLRTYANALNIVKKLKIPDASGDGKTSGREIRMRLDKHGNIPNKKKFIKPPRRIKEFKRGKIQSGFQPKSNKFHNRR